MTRFQPARDLDVRVANQIVRPRIEAIVADVQRLAQQRAPEAAAWVTAHDERVRPSHVHADAQTIPGNLRFVLESADGQAGDELARAPRDEALRIANRINCRCVRVSIPGMLQRSITAAPVVVEGMRVRGEVSSRFPRVIESEFPSEPDRGGHWMGGALDEVAAPLRGAAARMT